MKYVVATAIVLGSVVVLSAQKVVTNLDLAKYRDQRLEAEKQLKENYAKLGFPSPEEMAKQNEADDKARMELFHKLQAERLERERLAAQQQLLQATLQPAPVTQVIVERQDQSGYLYGYSMLGSHRYPWRSPYRFPYRGNFGWRVAGGMVIYDGGGNSNTVIGQPVQPRPVFRPTPRPTGGGRTYIN